MERARLERLERGKRGGGWGVGKGRVECLDGKVAVVLEVCLRHVHLHVFCIHLSR
jgi:hypothetical protein